MDGSGKVMTQDEIIEMARQAGLEQDGEMWFSNTYKTDMDVHINHLIAFAKLVEERTAAKEREACAKVCDDKHDTWRWDDEADSASGPRDCAAAIRARGEA